MRPVTWKPGRANRERLVGGTLLIAAGLAAAACKGSEESQDPQQRTAQAQSNALAAPHPGLTFDSAAMAAGMMHDRDCGRIANAASADSNAGTMGAVTDRAILDALREDCRRRNLAVMTAATALRATGEMMWSIPEYHDEQAFPLDANGFGPVAFIFASPFLGQFDELWQVEEHGPRGMVAAVVIVMDNGGQALPPAYTNLGLNVGINCVWLARAGNEWKSYVSPPSETTHTCVQTAPRTELAVIPNPPSQTGAASDYPPVARFSEAADPNGNPFPVPGQGQPLLGVRCVNSWCEIGPRNSTTGGPDFVVMTPGTTPPASGTLAGREHKIKGWHDEQWLAIDDGSGTGKLKPGFRAVVVPERGVNRIKASDFNGQGWRRVARIRLLADPPVGSKYAVMGLRKGWNDFAVRRLNNTWEARLNAGGGPVPLQLFDRVPHFDAVVPGTARFRWNARDDGIWVPCGQACCRVAAM